MKTKLVTFIYQFTDDEFYTGFRIMDGDMAKQFKKALIALEDNRIYI